MAVTVDPLLPLSLLEAVRTIDLPTGELETEFVHELRNKRLGLSDTVFAQIKRYAEAVKRKQRPQADEAIALAKLIGRRPDFDSILELPGTHLHWYGKEPKPRRKVGHVTVAATSADERDHLAAELLLRHDFTIR